MAITLPTDNEQVIDLDQLVQYLNTSIDVDDPQSLCSAAPMLRALANNRTFLADLVASALQNPERFQNENSYFSRALVLATGERYVVRAAVWLPDGAADSTPKLVDDERTITGLGNSIYGLAHNHAFPFLTVGYWGPGYATDIFECATDRDCSDVGDQAKLQFLEHTSLPIGKVMYYRQFADAHIQQPPTSVSVSLNILVSNDEQSLRDQHDFDLRNGTVAGIVGQGNDARSTLCWLAGELCGKETRALLLRLAQDQPASRVRDEARRAAAAISKRSRSQR